MKLNKWVLNTGYTLLVLLIIIGAVGVQADRLNKKPNNQYELLCYPHYYLLKDGERRVDSIPVGSIKELDNYIKNDNQ